MPKVVNRFLAFFTIVLLLQVVSSFPNFAAQQGTIGAVKLASCLLWAFLAFATVQGYEGPRKFIAFFACVGAVGALFGAVGGLVLAATTVSPMSVVVIAVSLISFFLQIGVYTAVTDETFKRWVVGKAIQRAEAKYAAAA